MVYEFISGFIKYFPQYEDEKDNNEEKKIDDYYEQVIKSIKEQVRNIPGKGLGYGVLRYLRFLSVRLREQLREQDRAQILFNYLGRIDIDLETDLKEKSIFTLDKEWDSGVVNGLKNIRNHLLK